MRQLKKEYNNQLLSREIVDIANKNLFVDKSNNVQSIKHLATSFAYNRLLVSYGIRIDEINGIYFLANDTGLERMRELIKNVSSICSPIYNHYKVPFLDNKLNFKEEYLKDFDTIILYNLSKTKRIYPEMFDSLNIPKNYLEEINNKKEEIEVNYENGINKFYEGIFLSFSPVDVKDEKERNMRNFPFYFKGNLDKEENLIRVLDFAYNYDPEKHGVVATKENFIKDAPYLLDALILTKNFDKAKFLFEQKLNRDEFLEVSKNYIKNSNLPLKMKTMNFIMDIAKDYKDERRIELEKLEKEGNSRETLVKLLKESIEKAKSGHGRVEEISFEDLGKILVKSKEGHFMDSEMFELAKEGIKEKMPKHRDSFGKKVYLTKEIEEILNNGEKLTEENWGRVVGTKLFIENQQYEIVKNALDADLILTDKRHDLFNRDWIDLDEINYGMIDNESYFIVHAGQYLDLQDQYYNLE